MYNKQFVTLVVQYGDDNLLSSLTLAHEILARACENFHILYTGLVQ